MVRYSSSPALLSSVTSAFFSCAFFSAVMVSRAIVNVFYGSRRRLDRVSIGSVWKAGAEAHQRRGAKAQS